MGLQPASCRWRARRALLKELVVDGNGCGCHSQWDPILVGIGEFTTHFGTDLSGWIESDAHWLTTIWVLRSPWPLLPRGLEAQSHIFWQTEGCPPKESVSLLSVAFGSEGPLRLFSTFPGHTESLLGFHPKSCRRPSPTQKKLTPNPQISS